MYLLLTTGQLAAIIGGGIDLSVSAVMTIVGVIGIKVFNATGGSTAACLTAMLAAGLAVGAVNGLLVVRGRINAFIATLGAGIVLQGVSLILTPRPIAPVPPLMKYVANGRWFGVPIVVFLGLALFALFFVLLRHTRFGRRLYAVGESDVKASWSGLPVAATKAGSLPGELGDGEPGGLLHAGQERRRGADGRPAADAGQHRLLPDRRGHAGRGQRQPRRVPASRSC